MHLLIYYSRIAVYEDIMLVLLNLGQDLVPASAGNDIHSSSQIGRTVPGIMTIGTQHMNPILPQQLHRKGRCGSPQEKAGIGLPQEPHLHFEITVNGKMEDPLDYFATDVLAQLGSDENYEG